MAINACAREVHSLADNCIASDFNNANRAPIIIAKITCNIKPTLIVAESVRADSEEFARQIMIAIFLTHSIPIDSELLTNNGVQYGL